MNEQIASARSNQGLAMTEKEGQWFKRSRRGSANELTDCFGSLKPRPRNDGKGTGMTGRGTENKKQKQNKMNHNHYNFERLYPLKPKSPV